MTNSTVARAVCALISLPAATVSVAAQSTAAGTNVAVNRVVDEFIAAQRGFDQGVLGKLTTHDYVEVSPVGDVDTREEMLSFYAPEKRRASPEIALTERLVRPFASSAIVLAKLTFTVPASGGETKSFAVRATYVVRRIGREWKIASAQYTPIRSS